MFAPNVNSYKRFRAGSFAPTGIAWSYDNRTAGFRVVGRGRGLRIECRMPGADANPYLAMAATLAAGLDGITNQTEPPPMFRGDVYAAADAARATARPRPSPSSGIGPVPQRLRRRRRRASGAPRPPSSEVRRDGHHVGRRRYLRGRE
jgi:glutamine synthetase